MNSSLDTLKQKRDALNARIKLVQNREEKKDRRNDTKRKILVGTYFLEQADKNGTFEHIITLMDKFLTRDSDRKAFGLPSKSK